MDYVHVMWIKSKIHCRTVCVRYNRSDSTAQYSNVWYRVRSCLWLIGNHLYNCLGRSLWGRAEAPAEKPARDFRATTSQRLLWNQEQRTPMKQWAYDSCGTTNRRLTCKNELKLLWNYGLFWNNGPKLLWKKRAKDS